MVIPSTYTKPTYIPPPSYIPTPSFPGTPKAGTALPPTRNREEEVRLLKFRHPLRHLLHLHPQHIFGLSRLLRLRVEPRVVTWVTSPREGQQEGRGRTSASATVVRALPGFWENIRFICHFACDLGWVEVRFESDTSYQGC